MFALKCEHVRFLQDFIVWLKCPQTETAQTDLARPKSHVPDVTDSMSTAKMTWMP